MGDKSDIFVPSGVGTNFTIFIHTDTGSYILIFKVKPSKYTKAHKMKLILMHWDYISHLTFASSGP